MGLQAFFFGTNLLCPAELHPCQGLSPCPVSSKPSGHQGKPASTWSSKGQHVLMESFLSFEPACSYSRIKQNFTHRELPFLWASLFISLNQAEFYPWLKTFSIRFYCTVGTKSCDSFSVLRQSPLLTWYLYISWSTRAFLQQGIHYHPPCPHTWRLTSAFLFCPWPSLGHSNRI